MVRMGLRQGGITVELGEADSIDPWLANGLCHATQLANHPPNTAHDNAISGIDPRTENIHASAPATFFPVADPWLVNSLTYATGLPGFLETDIGVIDPWLVDSLGNTAGLPDILDSDTDLIDPWLANGLNSAVRLWEPWLEEDTGNRTVDENPTAPSIVA
jgi:hypothetical protein